MGDRNTAGAIQRNSHRGLLRQPTYRERPGAAIAFCGGSGAEAQTLARLHPSGFGSCDSGELQVQALTERSAELEWLFKVTSNLKGGVDDKKVLQELVAEATSRLNSALGILYVPDKHLTVKYENDKEASTSVLEAWSQRGSI